MEVSSLDAIDESGRIQLIDFVDTWCQVRD
jgi:hypothetical protein